MREGEVVWFYVLVGVVLTMFDESTRRMADLIEEEVRNHDLLS